MKAGSEAVSVLDSAIANFQGDFAPGGATIRLFGVAADFTVHTAGSNIVLNSAADAMTVVLPIGTVGATLQFERSGGHGDSACWYMMALMFFSTNRSSHRPTPR